MWLMDFPFTTVDWNKIPATEFPGSSGKALWRILECGGVRLRMVEYSPGYVADHRCSRGHLVLVLEGELETELQDGRKFKLSAGMSYQVATNVEAHRSVPVAGAKLFIVD